MSHLKKISIVFILRIGWCGQRKKATIITKKVKCVQFLVWIMGIHYSQVLHKEPELFNNFLGTFRGLILSPNTDLIETVSDGLFTPSKI